MNLLTLQSVTKRYTATDPPAVDGVSFECAQGEIVALIGGSGSGKTTLLRIIAGLEIPDAGEVILNGTTINSPTRFVPPEKRDCGLVFQDYALFPNKTVSQNIAFGKGAADDPDRIGELMEMADIAGLEQRYPHEISGGQQQRVALVRALATRPSLLLLDEPLSHLDQELRDSVRSELLKLFRETDTTALFVSHDIEDAMVMADRMVVLREGTAEQVGTQVEIYDRPANPHVARLFGKTNFIPLGLLPEAPHSIADETGEGQVVPVRPHQW
ncbi:MAG: ABC transporter ATP-binding protein, partial [Verrucomicrobiota bacterium]|nr:ABC transporter ATP-binding protein [Verrucomicrobiota bacterium]